jgi:hypothetical protein
MFYSSKGGRLEEETAEQKNVNLWLFNHVSHIFYVFHIKICVTIQQKEEEDEVLVKVWFALRSFRYILASIEETLI